MLSKALNSLIGFPQSKGSKETWNPQNFDKHSQFYHEIVILAYGILNQPFTLIKGSNQLIISNEREKKQ